MVNKTCQLSPFALTIFAQQLSLIFCWKFIIEYFLFTVDSIIRKRKHKKNTDIWLEKYWYLKGELDPLKSVKTTSLSSRTSEPSNSYPTVKSQIWAAPLGFLGQPNIRHNTRIPPAVISGANRCCVGAGLLFLARAVQVMRRRSRRLRFLLMLSIDKLVPKSDRFGKLLVLIGLFFVLPYLIVLELIHWIKTGIEAWRKHQLACIKIKFAYLRWRKIGV